ncbi:MAG TPA: sulfatase-like hydrolase/transferase, partial [Acidimicrobiales bacterium]|nr:sulfatase-like hydrolase/transferase [Acidimicrobiales bacterium]
MARNVLFITVDQWRGDSLSCAGHPMVETPAIDALAARGVRFANHWANTAPCGPSRASIYTGMYMRNHRSVLNGTPLDARFTNIALEARAAGYDPVLFGYTDTSLDPRTLAADDKRLWTYESVLPGFRPVVHDPYEAGSLEWGKWLAGKGVDMPSNPRLLYEPDTSYPGAGEHGESWAPAKFGPDQTETAFMTEKVIEYLTEIGDAPFFVHVSYIRPHPPRRNPPGYHDLYAADDVPDFVAAPDRDTERAAHMLNKVVMSIPFVAAPADERDRRQLRATYHCMQREVDDQLGRLFASLADAGLAESTLVVLTSDHGEMGGDHWLLEKLGYWDESYHVPLVVVDPTAEADASRGSVFESFTESVDVSPTVLDWLGIEVPLQMDGFPLTPFLRSGAAPESWRTEAHFEWDFRHPQLRIAESILKVPSDHCWLAVIRTETFKYVEFAADAAVTPPLLFDLREDPGQLHDVSADPGRAELAWEGSRRLSQWAMRNTDRTLSNNLLSEYVGHVTH